MPAALAMSCMDVRSPDVAISDAAVSSTSVRRVPSSPPDWFARTVTAADSRHDRGQTVGLAERKFGKRYQEAGPVLATSWVGGNECSTVVVSQTWALQLRPSRVSITPERQR